MWSSHLFRTFCRKVYRPNCQVFQGVQRFSKITASRPVAVSRTLRATSCATPRFIETAFIIANTYKKVKYFCQYKPSIFTKNKRTKDFVLSSVNHSVMRFPQPKGLSSHICLPAFEVKISLRGLRLRQKLVSSLRCA